MVPEVESLPIKLLPMKNVRLHTVLTAILRQVDGRYLFREGHLEVTTGATSVGRWPRLYAIPRQRPWPFEFWSGRRVCPGTALALGNG